MFGDRLKKIRQQRGFTQEQLADKSHIARAMVARYETNRQQPTLEVVVKIADSLDISVDYLLGRTDIQSIYIHDIEVDSKHGRIASTQKDLSPEYQEQVRAKVQNAIKEDRGVKISASDLPSNRAELEALVQQIVDQALKKQDDQ